MSIAAVQPAAKRSTYCGGHLRLMPLKQVYCGGSLARRYSTPQNTRAIAADIWNAAIDPIYSGGPKKRCNRRHTAAVFAPAAIGPPQLLSFLVVLLGM